MESNRRSEALAARLDGLDGDGLLALAGAAVRRAAGQDLDDLDDGALVDSVAGWHRLGCAVHAELLRRVAAVEQRQAWRGQAYNGVNLWTARLGLSRGEARTLVDSALALQRMPETAALLAAGTLSPGHVADAARSIGQLDRLADHPGRDGDGDGQPDPETVAQRQRDTVEALDGLIAGEADRHHHDGPGAGDGAESAGAHSGSGQCDDGGVAGGQRMVPRQALRERLDDFQQRRAPGLLAGREQRLRAGRRLRLGRDRDADQTPLITGRLAPVTYAKARAVLHAIARQHGADDPRSFEQRCHDGLERILDMALASGQLPDAAGEQPRVLLLVNASTLHTPDSDTPDTPAATSPAETGASGAAATAGEAGACGATGAPGAAATAGAMLDGYGPVSSATARQICCDAEVTAVAMGTNGAVLDVGRDRRDPTRAQRRAVFARDQRCVGCQAPLAYCQIHHIAYWSRGGRTDLANLVAVCWDCHMRIHHHGWQASRNPHGAYTLHPPDRDHRSARRQRLAG